MTKSELKRARVVLGKMMVLFNHGKGWTRGGYALDKDGHAIEIESKKACRFCLTGGLIRTMDYKYGHPAARLLRESIDSEGAYYGSISDFNEAKGRTWADISRVMRKTIRRVELQLTSIERRTHGG